MFSIWSFHDYFSISWCEIIEICKNNYHLSRSYSAEYEQILKNIFTIKARKSHKEPNINFAEKPIMKFSISIPPANCLFRVNYILSHTDEGFRYSEVANGTNFYKYSTGYEIWEQKRLLLVKEILTIVEQINKTIQVEKQKKTERNCVRMLKKYVPHTLVCSLCCGHFFVDWN